MVYFDTKNVNHAYIIEGAKHDALLHAKAFAKRLQCRGGGVEPCNCVSCRTFDSGNHPDVFYVTPGKNKSIGVSDIRERVVVPAEIKPYSSEYKIYIIEAALLTAAAQNGLLKTLEEPPPYGVFLLLTQNAGALLPTVLSRCTTVKLPLPTLETAFAERMADAEFAVLYEKAAELHTQIENAVNGNDLFALLDVAPRIAEHKENIQTLLEIFMVFYRDMAVYGATGQEELLVSHKCEVGSHPKAGRARNDGGGRNDGMGQVEAIYTAMRRLKQNANLQLTIEVMLLDFMQLRRNHGRQKQER